MADKHELILSNRKEPSIVLSEASKRLIARGRNDGAVLVIALDHGPTFLAVPVLSELISRTIIAVSDDEKNQHVSHHALLILRPKSLTMVATDGYRLSFAMKVKQGELKIGVESDKVEKREKSIWTLYSGEPLAIGFSTPYILDFLDALSGAHLVSLAFKDGPSAMEMRPEGFDPNYRWRYLVMPRKCS
jgi:DNA polymerase III sliding clamp (beta) subunit (PCNA family)